MKSWSDANHPTYATMFLRSNSAAQVSVFIPCDYQHQWLNAQGLNRCL